MTGSLMRVFEYRAERKPPDRVSVSARFAHDSRLRQLDSAELAAETRGARGYRPGRHAAAIAINFREEKSRTARCRACHVK
jgi:hypothetical protein